MTIVIKFAVLKKPISNRLKQIQNLILGLFLTVFIHNISSNTFTKDFQQSGYVCELDADAGEFDEETFAYFGNSSTDDFSLAGPDENQFDHREISTGPNRVTKSYSLHFGRKRHLVLSNLKLFC